MKRLSVEQKESEITRLYKEIKELENLQHSTILSLSSFEKRNRKIIITSKKQKIRQYEQSIKKSK